MPKENLKDLLDGNELDLSLNNLTTVPVKDLVGAVVQLSALASLKGLGLEVPKIPNLT